MGMHFGVVAARAPWSKLLAEMSQEFGTFKDLGAVADLEHPPFGSRDDGMVAGEFEGAAYILDESLVLSSTNHTALQDISRRLDCVLAVCVGETVSGTFELFVAEGGQLRRFYSACAMEVSRPFDFGEHFASEDATSLEDIDGRGLFAAMKSLGFDYDGWYRDGTKRAYLWEVSKESAFGERGEIKQMLDEHRKKYAVPKDQKLKPTVVTRVLADGSVGYDIVSRPPRKSLLSRLVSMFRGS